MAVLCYAHFTDVTSPHVQSACVADVPCFRDHSIHTDIGVDLFRNLVARPSLTYPHIPFSLPSFPFVRLLYFLPSLSLPKSS